MWEWWDLWSFNTLLLTHQIVIHNFDNNCKWHGSLAVETAFWIQWRWSRGRSPLMRCFYLILLVFYNYLYIFVVFTYEMCMPNNIFPFWFKKANLLKKERRILCCVMCVLWEIWRWSRVRFPSKCFFIYLFFLLIFVFLILLFLKDRY